MLCEKYKDAVIEAAVSGDDLAPAVTAHAESCATCADELIRQRVLGAAIDANLQRQMNAPVPAAMLQRFEARLTQQPQPKRAPRFAPIFVGALAMLTVAAVVFLMLPRTSIHTTDPKRISVDPVQNASANQPPVDVNPLAKRQTGAAIPTRHMRRDAASNATEPQVIVPPDQELLLAQYAQRLKRQKVVLEASLRGSAPIEPSEFAVNEIRSIDIKPLQDLDTN